MTEAPSRSRASLAVAALDIGRVLADRDGVTFRAQGTCMYPTVRPGDVLRIRSCPVAEVAAGDIAVCRTPDYLFGHRVIATGERDGRAYVVTRPDRSHEGGDAPTFDDDLLGVVVDICRKGSSVPLRPTEPSHIGRWSHHIRLTIIEADPRVRRRLIALAARLQNKPPYRSLAHRWYQRARLRLLFRVRVPVASTLGEAIFRELEVGEFDVRETWHGRPVDRWTLTAHVDSTREPAAWATFVLDGDESWRAAESYVRVRYRGTGLDDALLQQADKILEGTENAR
jgi:hypothetical protein